MDLSRDGRADLVVANAGQASLSVLVGRGDGTYLPPVGYPVGFLPLP